MSAPNSEPVHFDELQQDAPTANQNAEQISVEISALQSIYGDGTIRLWHNPTNTQERSDPDDKTRYQITLNLPEPHQDEDIRVLVTLSPSYPSSPPQLQLLSKYIGNFPVDAALFGVVLKTYISAERVRWAAGEICVFDGIEDVLSQCAAWLEDKLRIQTTQALVEAQWEKERRNVGNRHETSTTTVDTGAECSDHVQPFHLEIHEAEPISDRKSVFVGRAVRITHPSQVPKVLTAIMEDRQISRAAHPKMNAWRCFADGVQYQDNDDDGESAAGGRLAHLLQIMEVNNVLVIVTRYFGGIKLGSDRFKLRSLSPISAAVHS